MSKWETAYKRVNLIIENRQKLPALKLCRLLANECSTIQQLRLELDAEIERLEKEIDG